MLVDFCLLVLVLWCIYSPFGSYGPKEIAKLNKKVFWDTQVHRRFYQNNRSDEIIFVFPISLKLLSSYSSNCVAIAKVSNCGLDVSDLNHVLDVSLRYIKSSNMVSTPGILNTLQPTIKGG